MRYHFGIHCKIAQWGHPSCSWGKTVMLRWSIRGQWGEGSPQKSVSLQGLLAVKDRVPALLCELSPRDYNWPLSSLSLCLSLSPLSLVGQKPPALEHNCWMYNVHWASCRQSSSGSAANVSFGPINGKKLFHSGSAEDIHGAEKHVDFIPQFFP